VLFFTSKCIKIHLAAGLHSNLLESGPEHPQKCSAKLLTALLRPPAGLKGEKREGRRCGGREWNERESERRTEKGGESLNSQF